MATLHETIASAGNKDGFLDKGGILDGRPFKECHLINNDKESVPFYKIGVLNYFCSDEKFSRSVDKAS